MYMRRIVLNIFFRTSKTFGNCRMNLFDPSRFTHNYSGQSSPRRSASNPFPLSLTSQSLLDHIAETSKIFDPKKRVLPGLVMNTEEDGVKWKGKKYSSELSTIIEDRKKEFMEKDELLDRQL